MSRWMWKRGEKGKYEMFTDFQYHQVKNRDSLKYFQRISLLENNAEIEMQLSVRPVSRKRSRIALRICDFLLSIREAKHLFTNRTYLLPITTI